MKKIAAIVLVLGAFTTASIAADQPTPESLVAAAKQASGGGGWDKIVTWHEHGKLAGGGGLTGTYESWIDYSTLRNSGTYQLGPDSGGQGWDGKQTWTTDASKQVRIETSEETLAGTIQDAYREAYALFFPGRYPAKMEYAGLRHADGQSYQAIKITPKSADPFEVWFDPKTHLIAREVQLTGGQPHSFLASDYRPYGGVLVPRKVIDRVANDPKFDTIFTVSSVAVSGPEQISRYAPPPPPVDKATWPAEQDSVTLPFQLLNNHIYLEAAINGHAPAPFMFDTGATNIIDTDAAISYGSHPVGATAGGGFGDKVPTFGMAKINSVSVAGFTLPDQVFTTISEPGWIAVEGYQSQGLVGYEFVKRAVLTIDYAKRQMTFTKPQAFHPPTGVQPVTFTFSGHTPMLPATVDGIPGQFELDTGSRGALTLMKPFVDAHGLTDKFRAKVLGTVGYGVGGPSRAYLGRAGTLVIGSVSIPSPVVEVSTDTHGAGVSTHTAGNIGGDILQRFTVTLDYAHQLAWFQPNDLNSHPEVYDRSGLWIMRAKDGNIEVGDVTTQSPAAKLGLKVGDEIESVNGKPAKDVQLYDLRTQFKGATGTSFSLAVKGPSGPKSLTLVLADQV